MSQTDKSSAGLTRRSLLTQTAKAAGAAAILTAARSALPAGGAWAAAAPEVTGATLGFIALTDSAPLIVAKVKGLFAKYGMPDVNVVKQASWGTTRDNLELGSAAGGIDGAHILTPMPYLMTTGKVTKNNQPLPMAILARLNTNGQAISVGARYKDLGITTKAKGLKEAFAKQKAEGKDVKCAVTFPGGTHDLWMRYWLASNGIDPDKDVSTIVVPPPQMVANMKVDTMEAFCVGEPWNAQLVNQGIGFTALTTGELWHDHPEKSLGMRADWVEKNPNAAKALLAAVIEAQIWCDKPENKAEMCQIVSGREWFKVPVEDILGRATGTIDYGDGRIVKNSPEIMKFWSDHASYPFQSHDLWFLTEDQRWGYLPADLDTKGLIGKVNRQDLWREAAKVAGATDLPTDTSRGIEKFFDGRAFDPANPAAYLASHDIKRIA
ncbi:bicarbonate-binding protein [Niveispirillum lacus]|uniref:Bicarbonate-binding protein n=1 Tax=Niveispirillum lacus TaxID=1981099 RepID=A0A255YYD3_9PROT|nr:CmpA/NrtA family ABC transporter substrate-binding protein [Niveispirillum lacus]OYQ34212.1 bicarbonate-binding protein [Niveispirillum lacus]